MKRIPFRNQLSGLLLGCMVLVVPIMCHAATPTAMDECAKELLLSYFPEQFVNETLENYNIPQDKWSSINQALTAKDKEIIKMVEEKAAAINPNPLKDPQQRQAAVKLFRETLLTVFTDVMRANGIHDEQNFQAMLDDIQKQKAKKFAECMQRQKENHVQSEKLEARVDTSSNLSQDHTDDHNDDKNNHDNNDDHDHDHDNDKNDDDNDQENDQD